MVFTDCESCTRPISTNPGSMEAGEYGLTRGTCFVARRLEVVAVAGLLWISWCVLGGADFLVFVYFNRFFFERTRPAASMRPPCFIYLSSNNEAVFCLQGKKASSYRGAYRLRPILMQSDWEDRKDRFPMHYIFDGMCLDTLLRPILMH